MMMIRGLCFGATALVLIGAASGGCSSDSSGSSSGTTSSSGDGGNTSSSSSGTSGTTSSSGASSGTSGASSSGTSGASSSGTSGSSGASSGDAGQDSGVTPTCAAYCASIATNCATDNKQYLNDANCAAVCAKLPVGKAADQSGDTLGCRTYHAAAAAGNALLHCPHAGPWGNLVCGDAAGKECDTFCEIDLALCTGADAAYPDLATCKTTCNAWARSATRVNAAQPTAGNTYDCRAWHLLNAAATPGTHCKHTKDVSAVCQ